METWQLALIAFGGVAAVILGVMWLKIHPFVALLTAAIGVGLASGMTPDTVLDSVQKGMGNTLGFVAIVVGLGSMFGMMLEESGGAERLAGRMVEFFGEARTGMALGLVGFLVCIPVFLDVALVMVLPLAVAAAKRTGRSVTVYALPMLSGMAVTHAFVPPTPGPTTVAQLLSADLGWVIALGIVTGLPTLIVTALISGTVLAKQAAGNPPLVRSNDADLPEQAPLKEPSVGIVLTLLVLPIALIVGETVTRSIVGEDSPLAQWLALVGNPITALLLATFGTFYFLGIRLGMPASRVQRVAERGLAPAGVILLVTGAGGVFKQVLIDSGIGGAVASALADTALPTLVLAWLVAAVIRVLQGSATVAMITAAGLVAELVIPPEAASAIAEQAVTTPAWMPALATLAIAAGASIASHVNDSGFWLVGRFLGLSVGETLRTWTIVETIVAIAGLGFILLTASALTAWG
jgi:Gnt-I system low-affinity gluconate transporter